MISQRTIDKPRVYFSHSTHSFGTSLETEILKVLMEKYMVICPNNHIGRVEQFKNYLNIINWADAVIVLENKGFIAKGVYSEVIHALKQKIPVWVIRESPEGFVFYRVDRLEYLPERTHRNHYGKLIIRNNDSPIQ